MKKFLTTLLIVLISSACFALDKPRWVGQPIYVYVPQYGNYSVLMKQAFVSWEQASKQLVRFKFVTNPNTANIEVEFVDFVTGCGSDHAVGCTTWSTRGGQFYKTYVTIGTKEYIMANGRRQIIPRTKEHIYGVMLHEAGHAIGVGHSEIAKSIMYPYDLDTMQYLTKEDLKLLYNKYH